MGHQCTIVMASVWAYNTRMEVEPGLNVIQLVVQRSADPLLRENVPSSLFINVWMLLSVLSVGHIVDEHVSCGRVPPLTSISLP